MKKILLLLLVNQCFGVFAQSSNLKTKPQFRSINQVGFLQGQAGAEPLIQSINGFQYKSYFTGIGVGLDYYKQRSVPVFLDVRKQLFNKHHTPFIYLNGGYHFAWITEEPNEWESKGTTGGIYYDAGVGYRFPAFKTGAFIISIGYTKKELSEEINKYPWRSVLPQPEDFQKFEYKLRRYSFKMGLTF